MGQPKQLLKFRGTSLLRRAIDTALAVPADQVIVVLGHAADKLLPECEATTATVVLNDQWHEGVSTSLRGGLAAVSSEAAGREVLEEFGLDVRLTGLVGVYSERGEAVVLVVYGGEILGGEPRPDGH